MWRRLSRSVPNLGAKPWPRAVCTRRRAHICSVLPRLAHGEGVAASRVGAAARRGRIQLRRNSMAPTGKAGWQSSCSVSAATSCSSCTEGRSWPFVGAIHPRPPAASCRPTTSWYFPSPADCSTGGFLCDLLRALVPWCLGCFWCLGALVPLVVVGAGAAKAPAARWRWCRWQRCWLFGWNWWKQRSAARAQSPDP